MQLCETTDGARARGRPYQGRWKRYEVGEEWSNGFPIIQDRLFILSLCCRGCTMVMLLSSGLRQRLAGKCP